VRAFPSVAEAVAHCKGVDVADGFWRFYSGDGSPLEVVWENLPGADDVVPVADYTLQRAMSGLWLQERMPQVVTVSGCGLATIDDLVELLKINRSKRIASDSARR